MTGDREDQGQTDNRVLWTEAHVQGQRPYRERNRIKVGKTCKQIKGWCIHSNKQQDWLSRSHKKTIIGTESITYQLIE